MGFSQNWLRFCKAEDEYFACRYNLLQYEEILGDDLKLACYESDMSPAPAAPASGT
jgi:hypothetical protein